METPLAAESAIAYNGGAPFSGFGQTTSGDRGGSAGDWGLFLNDFSMVKQKGHPEMARRTPRFPGKEDVLP
jgi:hypothetical protein